MRYGWYGMTDGLLNVDLDKYISAVAIGIYMQKQPTKWTRRDLLDYQESTAPIAFHDGQIHGLQVIIHFPRQCPVIYSTTLIHCRWSYRSNIQNRHERKRMFLCLGRQSRRESRVLFRCIALSPGKPGIDALSGFQVFVVRTFFQKNRKGYVKGKCSIASIRLTSAYITSQMDRHPHISSDNLEGKISRCIDLDLHMI